MSLPTNPACKRPASSGGVATRKVRYSLGSAWAHQDVSVIFDPEKRQFVFEQIRSKERKGKRKPRLESIRRDVKNLFNEDITGLPEALDELTPHQLMFPMMMCYPSQEA